eukprot:UN01187
MMARWRRRGQVLGYTVRINDYIAPRQTTKTRIMEARRLGMPSMPGT